MLIQASKLSMMLSITAMILTSKLVIMLKYQNTKIFFQKRNTPNWSEEVFVIKEVKKMLRGGCALLVVSLVKKLLEHSMKKSCRRPVKKTPKQ